MHKLTKNLFYSTSNPENTSILCNYYKHNLFSTPAEKKMMGGEPKNNPQSSRCTFLWQFQMYRIKPHPPSIQARFMESANMI